MLLCSNLFGCGTGLSEPDDYVTNEGYKSVQEGGEVSQGDPSKAIPVEEIKVGVLYISDPGEGSGYSYTHDLGIQGMQSNLGLSDAQIERKIVDDLDKDATQKAIEEEKTLYEKAHKKKSWFMTLAREAVWWLGKWKTTELDKFIEEEAPDVYFVPIYPVVYMAKLQLHILKKFPKPYVCYLWDDNYSYKPCGKNPFAYFHIPIVIRRLILNFLHGTLIDGILPYSRKAYPWYWEYPSSHF